MVRLFCLSLFTIITLGVNAQKFDHDTIKEKAESAIDEWKGYAEVLESYQGLSQYCRDKKFKNNVILTLNDIHHYDSLILQEELNKDTKKDITEFESKYSASSFQKHLHKECKERSEVEREKRNDAGGFAPDSYSSQKLIIETEMQRYIHHINKIVKKIRTDIEKNF